MSRYRGGVWGALKGGGPQPWGAPALEPPQGTPMTPESTRTRPRDPPTLEDPPRPPSTPPLWGLHLTPMSLLPRLYLQGGEPGSEDTPPQHPPGRTPPASL